ncbi:MAG: DNA/RNA non-specific endonuclease [Cyclobacteriaceae bacterium]|nr:DNA/RNA non-specific endonuclease [Cyclobacteriaceae bacterium]MCH8515035.1 DNA/RNA non-specific endonuclease [Cyclobacteriaceae bacterium]
MRHQSVLFLFLLAMSILLCAHSRAQSFDFTPFDTTQNQQIEKRYFKLSYSEKHEQPLWVAYLLTREQVLTQATQRTDDFRPDPEVATGSAELSDYRGSGYDRGHLIPAGDRNFSSEAMSETFYLSNMSPQLPAFNRGIWSRLEELVRQFAVDNDSIYVVTAGVLFDSLQSIGDNEVAIPSYYYKAILDICEPELKAIGFILPHEGSKVDLSSFAVSIDSLEAFTGIDFFYHLPDSLEDILERNFDISQWSFKVNFRSAIIRELPDESSSQEKNTTCLGVTRAGNPCKNRTSKPNQYCHHHQSQAQ